MKCFATFTMVIAIMVVGMALTASAATSANNVLRLDADAITGLSDGQTVATWNDSSGKGNNASGVNTPSYETAEFNGGTMPGVYFDGSADYFNIAHSSSINVTNNTVFVVTKTETTADRAYFLTKIETNGTSYCVEHAKQPNGYLSCGYNGGPGGIWAYRLTGGPHDNATGIATYWVDTSTTVGTDAFNMYWNGSLDNGGAADSGGGSPRVFTNGEPMRVGVVSYDGGSTFQRYCKGFIGELILFDTTLTTTEINDVNAYLGDKWGITVAGGGDAAAGEALLGGGGAATPGTLIYGK